MRGISVMAAPGAVPCPVIPGDEVRARPLPKPCVSNGKGAELQIRGMRSAGPGDDQARFLADLRALRDMAAIGYDELAARAHYPSNLLKEAENGPLLPGLPVLTAYVRACEGDVLDWEERWRRLASVVPEDPGLPVRPPGASPAAVAGARAGVGVAPPDVYDPERIRAALRGGHQPANQRSRRNGDPGIAAPSRGPQFADRAPAGWDAGRSEDAGRWPDADAGRWPDADAGRWPDADVNLDAGTGLGAGTNWKAGSGWDALADPAVTTTNGKHSAQHESRETFDSAGIDFPDSAERAGQPEEFRWLPDTEPEAHSTGDEFSWSGHVDATRTDAKPANADPWRANANLSGAGPAEAGPADAGPTEAGLAGARPAGTGLADAGRTETQADIDAAAAEQIVTKWAPLNQEDVLTKPERDDFWATPTPPAAADLQLPAASTRRVEDPRPEYGFLAQAQTAGTPALGQTEKSSAAAVPQQPAAKAAPGARNLTSAPSRASADPARHEKDRFFPARLLVIIIIAALIGSALVLILR
jgi:hypothetical protein